MAFLFICFLFGVIFALVKQMTSGKITVDTYEKMLDAEYRSKMRNEILMIEFLEYMKNKGKGK